MSHWRDDLCMEVHFLRRLVMDLPDHEVPEAAKLISQLKAHLEKLCGKHIQRVS